MTRRASILLRLRPGLLALALLLVFAAGVLVGQRTPRAAAASQLQDEDPTLQRLTRIWDLVHQEYFDQPIDDEALIQGAIDGMLDALGDPHTSYMPPDEFQMFSEDFSGSYSGIGALVEAEGDQLFIVSPYQGSPAESAGLEPGDEIVAVDGTPVNTFDDPMSAITLVRGPEGEPVTLLMRRDGEVFEVTIVRAVIPLISVESEMRDDGIGYVRIADFSQRAVDQLQAELETLLAAEPVGLIVDLRGNPGGSLDAAIGVTSQFIGEGPIMIEQWGDGRENLYEARPGGLATDEGLPLVVLVDAGSASASEIVAGAIQDRGRGQLVGERTYGKGTVQNWHDLGPDAGGVRVTVARWLTPNGTWVHERGIAPDIPILFTDADSQAERDVQLEAAVSLLLGQPLPEQPQAKARGGWIAGLPKRDQR